VRAALLDVQNDLFDLGGELCLPGMEVMKDAQVARLEAQAEAFNADLPMLKEFILPGGTRPPAIAHLCRTVCRRAERSMVRLHAAEPLSEAARRFINRLSDLLFILGRRSTGPVAVATCCGKRQERCLSAGHRRPSGKR
jgi:cob(I)alamin adenosyltransferase